MTKLGLPVAGNDDPSCLQQPCAALPPAATRQARVGFACRIYDERPERCAAFRCMLLAALEADEVDLAEAEGIVRKVDDLAGADREAYIAAHFLGRMRGHT